MGSLCKSKANPNFRHSKGSFPWTIVSRQLDVTFMKRCIPICGPIQVSLCSWLASIARSIHSVQHIAIFPTISGTNLRSRHSLSINRCKFTFTLGLGHESQSSISESQAHILQGAWQKLFRGKFPDLWALLGLKTAKTSQFWLIFALFHTVFTTRIV